MTVCLHDYRKYDVDSCKGIVCVRIAEVLSEFPIVLSPINVSGTGSLVKLLELDLPLGAKEA
jgi:hypothetical protein